MQDLLKYDCFIIESKSEFTFSQALAAVEAADQSEVCGEYQNVSPPYSIVQKINYHCQ